MTFIKTVEKTVLGVLNSGTTEAPRPQLDANNQSSVAGIYVIGDLAGAPVIKLAMEHGYDVIEHIVGESDAKSEREGVFDILIVGAGASGLNASLQAKERGLSCIVLEKETIASTIENFPQGKWVYAEPDTVPPKGKLWLDGASKEDLLKRWNGIVKENGLNVKTDEGVDTITRTEDFFEILSNEGNKYKAKRVILAIGQRGNPRKLNVPGEDREEVYHRLYSPDHYKDEDILVVGGGNSAIEAALTLAKNNRVFLSYRKNEFTRIFKDNEQKLHQAIEEGSVKPILNSNVAEFGDGEFILTIDKESKHLPYQHAFVLIGSELPLKFLKKQNLLLEGEWTGNLWKSLLLTFLVLCGVAIHRPDTHAFSRMLQSTLPPSVGLVLMISALGMLVWDAFRSGQRFAKLGIAFLICYSIYGVKVGSGMEFWPFKGWGYQSFSLFERPWAFWYTVLYTTIMTVFGISAMKKWGFDHRDRYQIWRFCSLISFQWILFFIVPEYLFQLAVKYQWVGEKLASDPQFSEQAWRAYGIVYAWPLFFYTFFYDPHQVWIVWGVLLSFVIIPIFSYFHGKRYCTWICGCGGLAETLGDRWRVLAPKGRTSIKWEKMNLWVVNIAFLVLGMMLLKDIAGFIREPANRSLHLYKIFVDVWLVGIIPVALYPFMGGKVWCRYWCPLAKLMGIFSHRLKGRFAIKANEKCIACYQCSRHCQVGIPVMQYALKQEEFGNWNSSCIGCGICVTVCPMDVLSFGSENRCQGAARK